MNELIKGSDGRVTRVFICACGTPLYRKDLTNDRYEFMKKHNGRTEITVVETGNMCKIYCFNCNLSHIVYSVREDIRSADKVAATVDKQI